MNPNRIIILLRINKSERLLGSVWGNLLVASATATAAVTTTTTARECVKKAASSRWNTFIRSG